MNLIKLGVIIIGALIVGVIYLQIYNLSLQRATINGAAEQFCLDRNQTLSNNQSWNFGSNNFIPILGNDSGAASQGSYIVCSIHSERAAFAFCETLVNYNVTKNKTICR